ncbi:hypothetical protein SAMN05660299_01708 [Megasphaera paucivorans]|uniref:Uncharacterized protein n=2 Tax=Megasphaera paucivorans TaxID=349095 RepID=A0A1G9WXX6_9FIRM|nr:hypothetical protein [Megasphaera paucivorans]SDM89308.1 hypothetical protein SAMN05660299_01708 [Megasphaera paucivorans]
MMSKMNQLQLIIEANLPGRMALQVGRISLGLIQTKTTRQVYIAVQDEDHDVREVTLPKIEPTRNTEQSIPCNGLKTTVEGSE